MVKRQFLRDKFCRRDFLSPVIREIFVARGFHSASRVSVRQKKNYNKKVLKKFRIFKTKI